MITIKEIADAASVSPVKHNVRTDSEDVFRRTAGGEDDLCNLMVRDSREEGPNAEEARKLHNCNLIIGPLGVIILLRIGLPV